MGSNPSELSSKQTKTDTFWYPLSFNWCGLRDSNPHGFPHGPEPCASANSAKTAYSVFTGLNDPRLFYYTQLRKKCKCFFYFSQTFFCFSQTFFSAFLSASVSFRLSPLPSFFSYVTKQHYEKSKNIYRRREEGKERKGKERKV